MHVIHHSKRLARIGRRRPEKRWINFDIDLSLFPENLIGFAAIIVERHMPGLKPARIFDPDKVIVNTIMPSFWRYKSDRNKFVFLSTPNSVLFPFG